MSDIFPPAHSPLALREDNAPPLILFDELAFEILSWLPVKSLVRFICVCKYWKSIISNPKFIKEHLQKSPKDSDLILTSQVSRGKNFAHSCSVRSSLKNPHPVITGDDLFYCLDLQKKDRIVGSCNGLACLVGELSRDERKEICVRFWNPATRLISKNSICYSIDLERHPYNYFFFGFGYDNLNDTYKVVAVNVNYSLDDDAEAKVYSLEDKCWRSIQNFPFGVGVIHEYGRYINGTLNWLAVGPFNSNQPSLIVSLDLGKETYTQLLLPCGDLKGSWQIEPALGVLMDCLCLTHDYKRTHFVVWQMKEFGVQKSWTRLLNISYQDFPIDALKLVLLSPLFMYKNADMLIMMASGDHCDQLQPILYNSRDNRVEPTNNVTWWIDAIDYVQSLVWPSSMSP